MVVFLGYSVFSEQLNSITQNDFSQGVFFLKFSPSLKCLQAPVFSGWGAVFFYVFIRLVFLKYQDKKKEPFRRAFLTPKNRREYATFLKKSLSKNFIKGCCRSPLGQGNRSTVSLQDYNGAVFVKGCPHPIHSKTP